MAITVSEKNFTHEVLKSSAPVLVNFWAPWCGLCRAISPLLSNFQSETGDHLKVVSINADENFKLANTYRLKTLPTFLLVVGGEVQVRLDEFKTLDDFRTFLTSLKPILDQLRVSTVA